MSAYKGLGSGRHNSALAPLSGATAEDGTTVTTFKEEQIMALYMDVHTIDGWCDRR